jgi:hypothetical protein
MNEALMSSPGRRRAGPPTVPSISAATRTGSTSFPAVKLAIEIDGREFHEGADVFERDRYRQNDLVNAGSSVLFPCRRSGDRSWAGRMAGP